MDSGVHVWSTPLGYCDGDTEGFIKDEEEVSAELQESGFLEIADPLMLTGDPLNLCTPDEGDVSDDPLTGQFFLEEEAERPDSAASLPAAGPSSVVSLYDDSSDESDCSQNPAHGMWFKAEPEDDSALAADHDVPAGSGGAAAARDGVRPAPTEPPALPEYADYPDSPDPPLPLEDLIDAKTGRRLFTCKVCRVSFRLKMMLADHYKKEHRGYRPYKCDICGKRYHRENFVRTHRKLHTNEKEFACRACGKAFICQTRLTVHRKTSRVCPMSQNFDAEAFRRRETGEAMAPNYSVQMGRRAGLQARGVVTGRQTRAADQQVRRAARVQAPRVSVLQSALQAPRLDCGLEMSGLRACASGLRAGLREARPAGQQAGLQPRLLPRQAVRQVQDCQSDSDETLHYVIDLS